MTGETLKAKTSAEKANNLKTVVIKIAQHQLRQKARNYVLLN